MRHPQKSTCIDAPSSGSPIVAALMYMHLDTAQSFLPQHRQQQKTAAAGQCTTRFLYKNGHSLLRPFVRHH